LIVQKIKHRRQWKRGMREALRHSEVG